MKMNEMDQKETSDTRISLVVYKYMKLSDYAIVVFEHSMCKETAVVGFAEIQKS